MGMAGFGLRDEQLRRLYAHSTGPVVFIDESYREPLRNDEHPFYAMSGVIVDRDQGSVVRDALMDITGGRYWHTTESYRSAAGQNAIHELVDYLATAADWNIVTVQTSIRRDDRDMAVARAETLTALAAEVTRGTGPSAARLLVMESRNPRAYPTGDRDDQRTIARLRSAGMIDRQTTVHHTSPGREPLLWAPDLSAWAFRRHVALDDDRWFAPLKSISTVLHVNGADVTQKRSNPHLPQPSPGVQSPGERRWDVGGATVASQSSLVFGGDRGNALAGIEQTARGEPITVEREALLAVGTDDQARLVRAAVARLRQPPSSGDVSTDRRLVDGARQIMPESGAEKVLRALTERHRRANEVDADPERDRGPDPDRDRGHGRTR